MPITLLLPVVAGVLFLVFVAAIAIRRNEIRKNSWVFPAFLSFLFLVFSLWTVATEGPLGFWTDHTRNLWGNQVWFDLLLAISIGWYLIVPQAKALGMRLWPWLLLIVATGCIGFLAMIARLLYLRGRVEPSVPAHL